MLMTRVIEILHAPGVAIKHAFVSEVGVEQPPLVQGPNRDRPEQCRVVGRQDALVTNPTESRAVQLAPKTGEESFDLQGRKAEPLAGSGAASERRLDRANSTSNQFTIIFIQRAFPV